MNRAFVRILCLVAMLVCGAGLAAQNVSPGHVASQGDTLPLVQVTPESLRYEKMYNGTEQANVVADITAPGPYAVRVRFPAGLKIQPHVHPEARIVLVMAGTLLVGYGPTFDETKLVALPAGSVFTEPAGLPHFTWARDGEVVLHATGVGPTKTTWVK